MTKQSSKYKSAPMARHYSLDCRAALAMTRVLSNKNTQSAGDTRTRISVIARNEMTKQSSKYKSAPMAQHYSLDCHATLAMTLFLSSIFLNFITLSLYHYITLSLYH